MYRHVLHTVYEFRESDHLYLYESKTDLFCRLTIENAVNNCPALSEKGFETFFGVLNKKTFGANWTTEYHHQYRLFVIRVYDLDVSSIDYKEAMILYPRNQVSDSPDKRIITLENDELNRLYNAYYGETTLVKHMLFQL